MGFHGGLDGKEICRQCRRAGVQSLGQEEPLEKEMATHSSILAWEIPWTEEPGGLQSIGSQRVRHNWETNTFAFKLSEEIAAENRTLSIWSHVSQWGKCVVCHLNTGLALKLGSLQGTQILVIWTVNVPEPRQFWRSTYSNGYYNML